MGWRRQWWYGRNDLHLLRLKSNVERARKGTLHVLRHLVRCSGHRTVAVAGTCEDFVAGAGALRGHVGRIEPAVVTILGISAYRFAFNQQRAVVGRQPTDLAGAHLYVVPDPSDESVRIRYAVRSVAVRAGATAGFARRSGRMTGGSIDGNEQTGWAG